MVGAQVFGVGEEAGLEVGMGVGVEVGMDVLAAVFIVGGSEGQAVFFSRSVKSLSCQSITSVSTSRHRWSLHSFTNSLASFINLWPSLIVSGLVNGTGDAFCHFAVQHVQQYASDSDEVKSSSSLSMSQACFHCPSPAMAVVNSSAMSSSVAGVIFSPSCNKNPRL